MRTSLILPLLLLAAAPAPLLAQEGPTRAFTPADLFGLEVASDPQISPDGSRIAYVRRTNDVMTDKTRSAIWLIDVKSGAQTPLVAGPGSHSQPRWSRDGGRLAYVSTAEGGAPQLYVRWMATGASARVTGLPTSPSSMAWSPDGTKIAYAMLVPAEAPTLGKAAKKPEGADWAKPLEVYDRLTYRTDEEGYLKPGFTQIFVVAADGGAPRQVTFGDRNADGPLSWTADGDAILFSGNRGEDWELNVTQTDIQQVDVATGAIRTLTSRKGPDGTPAVSPDGRLVAYTGYDDAGRAFEASELYVMNRDGSGVRALTAGLDRDVSAPVWSSDGRSIYVSYDDHGRKRVARVGLDGSIRTVADNLNGAGLDRPYTGGQFSVARDGTLAITTGSVTRPADVAVVRGGDARTLTHLNSGLIQSKALASAEKIPVTSFDGKPIDAWLMLPPGAQPDAKVPLILEIHGGPNSAYGPAFSTDDQLYAAAGYAVLYTNPRGSTSYGEGFANEIDKAYPGRDYDDLIASVDAAIATGRIDSNNLFVTGGSGGGVLTSWIVGKTDRFKAAAAQKPVINWTSEVLTADGSPFFAHYWFSEMPWENPQGYWTRSPLSLVGNVKTPTLVVVGAEDYRTPVSESEQYYTALKLAGVPTMLVKVPGASHGGIAARPSQAGAKAEAIIAWFDKYRNGGGTAAAGE